MLTKPNNNNRVAFDRHKDRLKVLLAYCDNSANNIVFAALLRWQRTTFPNLVVDVASSEIRSLAETEPVIDFATWLQRRSSLEESAYWLSTAYAHLVGDKVRSNRALYFTPPALAGRLIDHLLDAGASLTEDHWHDPACGGAAFLLPVTQRMVQALIQLGRNSSEVIRHVTENISGSDVDETLLALSLQFLLMALYHIRGQHAAIPVFRLNLTNSLLADSEWRPIDVVISNPPYRKLATDEISTYDVAYGSVLRGQSNLYALFMLHAMKAARDGGLLGLLTPTSYLSGGSFSRLRKVILERANVIRIERNSDRTGLFVNVQQETAIAILRIGNTRPGETSEQNTLITVRDTDGRCREVGIISLPNGGHPWPIPRSFQDVDLVNCARKRGVGLIEYGYIPRVGHLVHNRDKRRRYIQIPQGVDRESMFPLIWAADIQLKTELRIGGPGSGAGRDRFVSNKNNHIDRGVVKLPSIVMQRVTSIDQRRRLICAEIPATLIFEYGGYIAENHVIVLEQRGVFEFDTQTMLKILSSEPVDRLFRAISGASNVSVYELCHLLLPAPRVLKIELEKTDDFDAAIYNAIFATSAS